MSKCGCFSEAEKTHTSLNELSAQNEERLMNDVKNFVNPNKEGVLKDLNALFHPSDRNMVCDKLSKYFYYNRGNVKRESFTLYFSCEHTTKELLRNVNKNASSMEIYEFLVKRYDCFPMPESHSIIGNRFMFQFPPHLFSLDH